MFPEIFETLHVVAGWLPLDQQKYVKAMIVLCWIAVTKSTPMNVLDVIGMFTTPKVRSIAKGARACNSIVKSSRTIQRVVDKQQPVAEARSLLSLFETMSLASASLKIAQNIAWFLPFGTTELYKGMSTLIFAISSFACFLKRAKSLSFPSSSSSSLSSSLSSLSLLTKVAPSLITQLLSLISLPLAPNLAFMYAISNLVQLIALPALPATPVLVMSLVSIGSTLCHVFVDALRGGESGGNLGGGDVVVPQQYQQDEYDEECDEDECEDDDEDDDRMMSKQREEMMLQEIEALKNDAEVKEVFEQLLVEAPEASMEELLPEDEEEPCYAY